MPHWLKIEAVIKFLSIYLSIYLSNNTHWRFSRGYVVVIIKHEQQRILQALACFLDLHKLPFRIYIARMHVTKVGRQALFRLALSF